MHLSGDIERATQGGGGGGVSCPPVLWEGPIGVRITLGQPTCKGMHACHSMQLAVEQVCCGLLETMASFPAYHNTPIGLAYSLVFPVFSRVSLLVT